MSKPSRPTFAFLCFLSLVSLSACELADSALKRMQSGSHHSSVASAEFRYVARQTYQAAQSRSCKGAAIDYPSELSDEIAVLRAFENQTRSSPAGFHLSLARADVGLDKSSRCWSDSDRRFAERHIEMAREDLTRGLEILPELASALPGEAVEDRLPSEVSSAFRARVAPLVWAVNPMCRLSSEASDRQIIRPATVLLGDFERRIADTPFALHFAIAKADVLFEQSITLVECASPNSDAPERMRVEREERMTSQIAAIEAQFLSRTDLR